MSKKSFKVSKSLYLNPINLATILDPQDGELAIDINDSNKLKKYSTTSSTWVEVGSGGGGGASALNDLTDVTISSVQDGQILVYNSTTSQWENQTIVVEETVTEVTILNNQSTPVNTGITFLYPAVKSFELFGHIIRTTSTGEKSEAIKILGIYHTATSSWEITDTAVGNSGVVFSITAGGNLQYTSDNMSGVSYVGVFKYGYEANGGDKNFVSSMIVTDSDSYMKMDTATVSSNVVNFTNVTNMGDAVTKTGNTFIINKSGIFDIGAIVTMAPVDGRIFITKNSTVINSTDPAVLAWGATHNTGSYEAKANWSGYLEKDTVIRFTANTTLGASGANQMAYISYQGTAKILNPSSDQKVDIPTHELRFEGASSRGSTDTAIVKFDTLAKIKGDGFTVVNTAANGTVVTIKKAGKLDISTSFGLTANSNCYLTKNSTQLTGQPTIASDIMGFSSSEANGLQFVNMNWSGEVSVGDIIRIHATANPSNSSSSLNLVLQEKSVAVALQNVAPRWDNSDSAVNVNTSSGLGTNSGNKVLRFANLQQNFGSAIEYIPSSTLGDSFLIKENGLYDISFTNITTLAEYFCISVNNPDLTSVMNSIPIVNVLANGTTDANNYPETISTQVYLSKGDIVRAQSNGASVSSVGSTVSRFSITKVGKTQGTVDVTPFVNIPQSEVEEVQLKGTAGYGSVATKIPYYSTVLKNTNKGILQITNDSVNGLQIRALKRCDISLKISTSFTTQTNIGISKNSTQLTTNISGINSSDNVAMEITAGAGYTSEPVYFATLEAGDVLRPHTDGGAFANASYNTVSILATASSSSIISQTDQVSSDTISLAFKPTAIVDSDPVGTFNTYLYTANTNNAIIQSTAPTQTVADMNVNGIRIYARPFNSAGTVGLPARVDIKIGKGLKNFKLLGYANTGKTGDFSFDRIVVSSTDERGLSYSYSEATGILSLNAGSCYMSSTTTRYIDAFAGLTNGYFAFNASKTASLITVPNLQPRIAYLSDVKPSGTGGGTATSGAYAARTLNTIVDNTGIVTSLASNQFTLPAGTYDIEAIAPAGYCNSHKIKLRNITDSTDAIMGGAAYGSGSSGYYNVSEATLMGTVIITSPKTFEIQHRVETTRAGDGFGPGTAFGDNNIFTQVKITKIK